MVAELPKMNLAQTTWGKNNLTKEGIELLENLKKKEVAEAGKSIMEEMKGAGFNYSTSNKKVAAELGIPAKTPSKEVVKESTGLLGKVKGLGKKALGWAKNHKVAAGAIGVGAALLGISAISKNSKEKKAEKLSINA